MKMSGSIEEELASIKWFSRWGHPLGPEAVIATMRAESEAAAIASLCGAAWEDTTLEARNLLTEHLCRHAPDAYRTWNLVTQRAKAESIEPLTRTVLIPFAATHNLPQRFIHAVQWDLLAAVMEHAYREEAGLPSFFTKLLSVYRAGHVPCGWAGNWPVGAAVVW